MINDQRSRSVDHIQVLTVHPHLLVSLAGAQIIHHDPCSLPRLTIVAAIQVVPSFAGWSAVAFQEAVFSPNPMRYRPIWSCDFRYNFHELYTADPMIKS